MIDLNRLGGLVTKTISRDYRAGNPPPRVSEIEAGMINSIGLPTKGLQYFLDVQLPDYRRYTPPLVASVTSTDIDDFAAMARDVSVPGVAAIELNISCPTREPGGGNFALNEEHTYQVVKLCRAATQQAAVGQALAQRGGHLRGGGGGGEGRRGRDHRVEHDPRPQDQPADVPLLHRPGLRRDLRSRGQGDHPAHGSPVREVREDPHHRLRRHHEGGRRGGIPAGGRERRSRSATSTSAIPPA